MIEDIAFSLIIMIIAAWGYSTNELGIIGAIGSGIFFLFGLVIFINSIRIIWINWKNLKNEDD